MAICSNPTARYSTVFRRGALVLCVAATLAPAQTTPPVRASAASTPRAHVVKVERAFLHSGSTSVSGAGVRAFQNPEPESRGLERFDIRWYANPPGIQPGAVILVEVVQARSPSIYNRVLRIPDRAVGHVRSIVEIPADAIQRAGRVRSWRVSVTWRGQILARQSSPNWRE